MIKAVFFDVDGTLLTNQSQILPSTKQAIKQLQKQGILCGIATGRGPSQLKNRLDNVMFDLFVTYNGQLAYNETTTFVSKPFSQETVQAIAEYSIKEKKQAVFGFSDELKGSYYMTQGEKKWLKQISNLFPKNISASFLKKILRLLGSGGQGTYKKLMHTTEPVYQCMMVSDLVEQPALSSHFPNCDFTRSSSYLVDILPKNGAKEKGIQSVCDVFGITREEIMVFGDSWNDIGMLKYAGVGIAMGNALPEVKKSANYVTSDNNHDGIMNALNHYQIFN